MEILEINVNLLPSTLYNLPVITGVFIIISSCLSVFLLIFNLSVAYITGDLIGELVN